MFLLLILAIVIIYFAVRDKNPVDKSRTPSALEILERRYARGEINREEFLNLKKDLGY